MRSYKTGLHFGASPAVEVARTAERADWGDTMIADRQLTTIEARVSASNDRGILLAGQSRWFNYSAFGNCSRASTGQLVRVSVDEKGWMQHCVILARAADEHQEPEPPDDIPPLADEPEQPARVVQLPAPAPAPEAAPAVPQLRPYDLAVIRMSAVKSATAYIAATADKWQGEPLDILAIAMPLAQWMTGEIGDEQVTEMFITRGQRKARAAAQLQELPADPAPKTKPATRTAARAVPHRASA